MTKRLLLEDPAAAIFNRKEKNLYFLLVFFFFALYMPGIDWLYNVGMWALFVYSFFYNTVTEKLALLKKRKAVVLLMAFLSLQLNQVSLEKHRLAIICLTVFVNCQKLWGYWILMILLFGNMKEAVPIRQIVQALLKPMEQHGIL